MVFISKIRYGIWRAYTVIFYFSPLTAATLWIYLSFPVIWHPLRYYYLLPSPYINMTYHLQIQPGNRARKYQTPLSSGSSYHAAFTSSPNVCAPTPNPAVSTSKAIVHAEGYLGGSCLEFKKVAAEVRIHQISLSCSFACFWWWYSYSNLIYCFRIFRLQSCLWQMVFHLAAGIT